MSCIKSGDLGSIPAGFWNLLQPLGHFAWHWASQCTDMRAFYVAALDIILFSWISSVSIWRWQVLALKMNIRLPLFWSTLSQARGQNSATCAGLAHGRVDSYCRALELKLQKVPGHCFSSGLNCPKYLKTMAWSEGLSTLTPQTALFLISHPNRDPKLSVLNPML